MNKILVGLFVVSIFSINPVLAQYCNKFHNSYCEPSENDFFSYNGQSKSALFAKGQTSELSIIVYKGQDYRISFCVDQNLGEKVEFKLYETKKVKVEKIFETKEMEDVLDDNGEPTGEQREVINKEKRMVSKKVKELLFDNSTDNYVSEIEFSVESTRRLTLEVTIPGEGGSGKSKGVTKGKGKSLQPSDMGCVGVLVEHMPTPRSGF